MFLIKRNNIYYIEFKDPTTLKTKRVSTKKRSLMEANAFMEEFKTQFGIISKVETMSAQALIPSPAPKIPYLNEFAQEYKKYTKQIRTPHYNRDIDLAFRKFEEAIGNLPLNEITTSMIDRFLSGVHSTAKYAAHLYHRTLKAAFQKALDWDLITTNPFKKIKLPKLPKKFPIFITKKELDLILAEINNETLKKLVFTSFYTGMRQGELINMQWNWINLKKNEIKVINTSSFQTKSKADRTIPIHKNLKSELLSINKKDGSDFVFTNNNNVRFNSAFVTHKFKDAVRAAKLNDEIHFHTLRHSFASNLAQKGISIYIIKELLGHADITTTQIYSHLNQDVLINAIKQF